MAHRALRAQRVRFSIVTQLNASSIAVFMTRNSRFARRSDAFRLPRRSVLLLSLMSFWLPGSADAQITWDPAFTHLGSDGSGIWDLTTANWASSGTDVTWPNTFFNIASFGHGGIAGTITVVDGVKTNGLIFDPVSAGNYLMIGGTLMFGGSAPSITTNSDASISASLDGGGLALTKSGTGTLNLNGSTSNLPTIKVTAGTLRTSTGGNGSFGNSTTAIVVSNNARISTSGAITVANPITFNGGVGDVAFIGGATLSGPITLASGDSAINASTQAFVSGTISGAGNFVKSGSQKLTLTGTNNYSGTTSISNGALQIGNGGTTGTLGLGTVNNNGSLIFNRSDSYTVANTITGAGSLTKNGQGVMTLSGVSVYTGNTTVSEGTLLVDGTLSGGTSSQVIVANGATLGGTGTIIGASAGAVTLLGGAVISPGDFDSIGTLSLTSLAWTSNNTSAGMVFDLSNTDSTSDTLSLSGSFTRSSNTTGSFIFDFQTSGLPGNTYTLMTFGSTGSTSVANLVATNLPAGLTGTFQMTSTSLKVAIVPEPSAAWAGGVGMLILFQRARRRSMPGQPTA